MKFFILCLVTLFASNSFSEETNLFMSDELLTEKNERFERFLDENNEILTQARMGDVVGNGGGLVEAQVAFFYNSLPKAITSAIEFNQRQFNPDDMKILTHILNNVQQSSYEEKILMLNDQKFFNSEGDQEIRAAKTGFDQKYQIFINRELLYQNVEKVESLIVPLLIHEFGHQAGVSSHSYLEELGTKVKFILDSKKDFLTQDSEYGSIWLTAYNYVSTGGWADLVVIVGDQLTRVKKIDYDELKKLCKGHFPGGFEYSNLHWERRPVSNDYIYSSYANAWMDLRCDTLEGDMFMVSADVEIVINIVQGELKAFVRVIK